MKLATWNLMLPVAARRREAIRRHTDIEGADVWVLTESHDGFSPALPHSHSSAPGRDGRHGPGHRWVSIWSRYPLTPVTTSDAERTAAVRVLPPSCVPFVVFGTVLPWFSDVWRGHAAKGGVAFREALKVQVADWKRLRSEYPGDEFFVLGDFNQDLVTPKYYGSRANRAALEAGLAEVGLQALTGGVNDPMRRDSPPCACIDHICGLRESRWRAKAPRRWPDTLRPVRWMTDHFGVAVELESVNS